VKPLTCCVGVVSGSTWLGNPAEFHGSLIFNSIRNFFRNIPIIPTEFHSRRFFIPIEIRSHHKLFQIFAP
jgi:hypothetical protein